MSERMIRKGLGLTTGFWMPGEARVDSRGIPVCGEGFMAGTICSDEPGHKGGHSCICQVCGGDWMNDTCTCAQPSKED